MAVGENACEPFTATAPPFSVALVALVVVHVNVTDPPLTIEAALALRVAVGTGAGGGAVVPLSTVTVTLDVTLCELSFAISTYSVVLDGETCLSPSDETATPFNVTDFASCVDHVSFEEPPSVICVGSALRRALSSDSSSPSRSPLSSSAT